MTRSADRASRKVPGSDGNIRVGWADFLGGGPLPKSPQTSKEGTCAEANLDLALIDVSQHPEGPTPRPRPHRTHLHQILLVRSCPPRPWGARGAFGALGSRRNYT